MVAKFCCFSCFSAAFFSSTHEETCVIKCIYIYIYISVTVFFTSSSWGHVAEAHRVDETIQIGIFYSLKNPCLEASRWSTVNHVLAAIKADRFQSSGLATTISSQSTIVC